MNSTLLKWAGLVLGLASLGFVGLKIRQHWGELSDSGLGEWALVWGFALAIVYCAANFLLATGWYFILRYLKLDVPFRWALECYAISQIGKYLPGNLFQFAGRQVLGMSAGLPGRALIKSTVVELACLVVAGCVFVILFTPLFVDGASERLALMMATSFASVLVCLALLFGGVKLTLAFLSYFTFLVCSGGVFVAALMTVRSEAISVDHAVSIAGAYVVAWLAGLLTPGAPAGIGVREAVGISLMQHSASETSILLAILIGRIVTLVGDFFFYCLGGLMGLLGIGVPRV